MGGSRELCETASDKDGLRDVQPVVLEKESESLCLSK